jgi:RNA polymerase sigma-70 factor (ECF subfamily)
LAGADRAPSPELPLSTALRPPLRGLEEALQAFRVDRGEDSFRRLYRLLAPRLYGLALRMLGAGSEAEEAVQEAWLRALRDLDRFAGRSRFETWMGGIVVRCCLEQRRRAATTRRRLAHAGEERSTLDAPSRVDVTAAAAPARLDAETALLDLADGYRAVLLLHDLYGYTHAEIAQILDIEEGTSKSQLARARRAARANLSAPADR